MKKIKNLLNGILNVKKGEEISAYDGVSFVKFNLINKIIYLKEFGCNINNYDPYKKGDIPEFIYENVLWN